MIINGAEYEGRIDKVGFRQYAVYDAKSNLVGEIRSRGDYAVSNGREVQGGFRKLADAKLAAAAMCGLGKVEERLAGPSALDTRNAAWQAVRNL